MFYVLWQILLAQVPLRHISLCPVTITYLIHARQASLVQIGKHIWPLWSECKTALRNLTQSQTGQHCSIKNQHSDTTSPQMFSETDCSDMVTDNKLNKDYLSK